ncbi:MAG: factor-independent urate hydroxylase [Candidatus Solibacter sp.]
MHEFASGKKRNYYGKGDVSVYRLLRDGKTPGAPPVFGANVKLLIYGDAFWPTYETGDNTGLIATDSMKNFIQRETMTFPGDDLEEYCLHLATKFLQTYPHVEGAQIRAVEIPYHACPVLPPGARPFTSTVAFAPTGPDVASTQLELRRVGATLETVELRSGIEGFRLLRLGGSAFHGFVRDQYTTLPDIHNRPLHMWLRLNWVYNEAACGYTLGAVTRTVRAIVREVFHGFESGSIQQIIYQIGMEVLARIPQIAEVDLEGQNRTWDTIAESGEEVGVYTDARPPYGCLGLSLRR